MMKSSLITRLFAILCMIIIGGANSWADENIIFSYTVPTTESVTTDTYTTAGGTVSYSKEATTDANGYKLDNDTKYIKITLTNNTLTEGDIINVIAYSNSNNGGIIASNTNNKTNTLTIGTLSKKSEKLSYTVTSTDILSGKNDIYLFRNGVSTWVQSITILRQTNTPTPIDPIEEGTVYQWNTIGKTTDGTNCYAVDDTKIVFGSNYSAKEGKYLTIAPTSGGFKAGDVITIKGYCDSKNASGIEIHSTPSDESIFKTNTLNKSTEGGSEYTFTITEDCDALYFGRFGGGNVYITALTVVRPTSTDKTKLTASFETKSSVIVNTTTSISLPSLTVKAGETTLSSDQYSAEYKSNAESVATINGNTITIKGTGTVTITATITPTDNETYEGCTATYQITVKEPTPLNISVQDVVINVTDKDIEQPIIKVYGDNDKLLIKDTDYTLTFTVEDGSNVSVDENGVFKVSGSEYNWTKGTSTITVTATPISSLGETYTKGTLSFTYDVTEGKITPKFLSNWKNTTINLHCDNDNREFTVPLIFDGEDVSDYFDYTYTIDGEAGTLKTENGKTTHTLIYAPKTTGEYTVVVSAEPKNVDDDDYHDVYNNPENITFTFKVSNDFKRITIKLDPEKINMYTGTTEGAPDVTVTYQDSNDGDIVPETKYTATWITNNPGVVRIDAETGRLEGISEGDARGRCLVKGDYIESTTLFFDIKVDDPAVYRVNTSEEYGNQRIMWNEDRTLSVTLGGWMFPKDGTPLSDITSDKMSKDKAWLNIANQAKWKLTGYTYYVNGDKSTNARQENGANALPESTTIYDKTFQEAGTIKDPMFNVPCSGSYLVFNPNTIGTVKVNIFQNGVFDKDGDDYQYRPQRRVFVMDEAGNFVSSTAQLGNANGKPTGGVKDWATYKWDLKNNQSPTKELLKEHFPNISNNFDMTNDNFKNNVYINELKKEVAPNKAAENHPDDESAKGWSVLADSPVTYTFKVKPGKTYYLYCYGSKISLYGFSFEKEETAPTVDNIEYKEEQTNTITETKEGHVATVSIDRSFKKGVWTTCVLPFSLNKPQVDAIFGTTYSVSDDGSGTVETHKDGTQILYFDHVEGSKAYFVRHAYNTIVAGKPFLIKPTKDVESINTGSVKDHPYVTIESTTPADWCESNGYVWKSSYSNDMTVQKGDCFISNSNGTFKNFVGEPGTLKGFRGYLKASNPTAAKKLQIATFSNTGEDNDGTTGIEDLIIDEDGEICSHPVNGRVYNINGQLVSEDASNFKSLPSGVYIINGKKYIK